MAADDLVTYIWSPAVHQQRWYWPSLLGKNHKLMNLFEINKFLFYILCKINLAKLESSSHSLNLVFITMSFAWHSPWWKGLTILRLSNSYLIWSWAPSFKRLCSVYSCFMFPRQPLVTIITLTHLPISLFSPWSFTHCMSSAHLLREFPNWS